MRHVGGLLGSVSVIAIALLPAGPATAQNGTAPPPGPSHLTAQPNNRPNRGAAPSVSLLMPASEIVGRELRDPQSKEAGRIDQIVLDTGNGAVDFVIVVSNGSFDIGGGAIAVPWQALKPPSSATGPITVNVPAGKLAQAPRIGSGRLASLLDRRRQIYGWYGYGYPRYPYGARGYRGPAGYFALGGPGYGGYGNFTGGSGSSGPGPVNSANGAPRYNPAPAAGVGGTQAGSRQANAGQGGSPGQQPTANQLIEQGLVVGRDGAIKQITSRQTASQQALQGADVYAQNGNYVGTVDQVMIDVARGEVAFALLSRGGFLGLNQSLFALPVEALAWAPSPQGQYRLTVDEARLDSEPSVRVTRLDAPIRVPDNQIAALYRHFGITPYWQHGQSG
jgi:sporulation protein YlmC with PRC-barrel domain